MKLFSTIAVAAMSMVFMTLGTSDAEAKKCGCVKEWKQCFKKARSATKKPKAGEAAKNLKNRKKMFKKCDKAFNKCSKKCEKKCVSQCRDRKKVAKQSCKEDFKDTLCPVKGKDHRECKREARDARNACKKEAKEDNCRKMCK